MSVQLCLSFYFCLTCLCRGQSWHGGNAACQKIFEDIIITDFYLDVILPLASQLVLLCQKVNGDRSLWFCWLNSWSAPCFERGATFRSEPPHSTQYSRSGGNWKWRVVFVENVCIFQDKINEVWKRWERQLGIYFPVLNIFFFLP